MHSIATVDQAFDVLLMVAGIIVVLVFFSAVVTVAAAVANTIAQHLRVRKHRRTK